MPTDDKNLAQGDNYAMHKKPGSPTQCLCVSHYTTADLEI